ncbi:L-rhamnose mutarotase [Prolixibacteraceae bacterium]|nr:L-rhamnose mutarotase [Prolixibacteraceae bacterium]
MKRYLIALTVGLFSLGSCTKQEACSDKMRRFVFVSTNSSKHIHLNDMSKDKRTLDLLLENGLVNVGTYTKDTVNLVVLDTEPNLDFNKCKEVVNSLSDKTPELRSLARILNGEYQLIDRIYKMEQNEIYLPSQGQLISKPSRDYQRTVMTLEINNDPDLLKEYAAVHALGKAWPEITENMKTVGIKDMEIYMVGYRAFLLMDTKPDFDMKTDGEKWGKLPREKEWQTYVAKFQKTDPESKAVERWKVMH